MRLSFVVVLLALVIATEAGAATPPSVLTAVPAVGTAYWKADCKRERWALGFRVFGSSATTTLTFHAGGRRRSKVVQPRQTAWFAFTGVAHQILRVDQFTEAGRLRAVLTLDYAYPGSNTVAHCYAYAPPRLTLQVYPR